MKPTPINVAQYFETLDPHHINNVLINFHRDLSLGNQNFKDILM